MKLKDDGDIVRAIGFVTLYAAYIEDNLSDLIANIKKSVELPQNIEKKPISNQAKTLVEKFKNLFDNTSEYTEKNKDRRQIEKTLENIKEIMIKRNETVHSAVYSKRGEYYIQKNRRQNNSNQIESNKIYDLANELFDLSTSIMNLEFPINRLLQRLARSE